MITVCQILVLLMKTIVRSNKFITIKYETAFDADNGNSLAVICDKFDFSFFFVHKDNIQQTTVTPKLNPW